MVANGNTSNAESTVSISFPHNFRQKHLLGTSKTNSNAANRAKTTGILQDDLASLQARREITSLNGSLLIVSMTLLIAPESILIGRLGSLLNGSPLLGGEVVGGDLVTAVGDLAAVGLHVGSALVLAVDLLGDLGEVVVADGVALLEGLTAVGGAVALLFAGESAAGDGEEGQEGGVELHLEDVNYWKDNLKVNHTLEGRLVGV